MVDRAVGSPFLTHQDVATVEIKGAKLLARGMGQRRPEIDRQSAPGGQDRPSGGLGARHRQRHGAHAAQLVDAGGVQPGPTERRDISCGYASKALKPREQISGRGTTVCLRQNPLEHTR
ncbi:hypothetical protein D3C73_1250050 [compost metagenome]